MGWYLIPKTSSYMIKAMKKRISLIVENIVKSYLLIEQNCFFQDAKMRRVAVDKPHKL